MDDPWEKAVHKLYELTEARTLRWDRATYYIQSAMIVGLVYTAKTSGKTIVIYEERDGGGGFITKDSHVVIEFVDEKWQTEWRWPGMSESWRFLESVRFQVAAGQDFLQDLLAH